MVPYKVHPNDTRNKEAAKHTAQFCGFINSLPTSGMAVMDVSSSCLSFQHSNNDDKQRQKKFIYIFAVKFGMMVVNCVKQVSSLKALNRPLICLLNHVKFLEMLWRFLFTEGFILHIFCMASRCSKIELRIQENRRRHGRLRRRGIGAGKARSPPGRGR